jgi:HaeII restriction endonuclease
MNIDQAKQKLDRVIGKGRVHFYKPFQIAEVLRRHRRGEVADLLDLESYKNVSRKWRDEISSQLVGRSSNSSARYQDDVFNDNACPPEALVALGDYNVATRGAVEAYVYRIFEAKIATIGAILAWIRKATPETFDLAKLVSQFEHKPGLRRSIDKVFEITVYALFATVVRALRIKISLTVGNADPGLIERFGDFMQKVVGLSKGSKAVVLDGSLFRVGSTNAADRGLDIVANFGPAIQVKHLTLDADAIADICDGLSANRIVIVCRDTEVAVVDAVIRQLGLADRLQGLVTLGDLLHWYDICLGQEYGQTLGESLLRDLEREFAAEFPSLDGLAGFMAERGYRSIKLAGDWGVNAD